jgi:hypothetical protein
MKNSLFIFFIILTSFFVRSQVIYQHNFGTATIAGTPYTVAPTTVDPNFTSSSWATSNSTGFVNFAGSTGQALSMTLSPTGTKTYTLSLNVGAGSTVNVNSFSFWLRRSNTGPTGWSMTINSISVGSGTMSGTAGITVGTTLVSSPVQNLTTTVTVVLTLTGGSSGGTFRLDDFTLNGSVVAPPPSNDNCSSSTSLPCGTSSLAGTTVGSVSETAPLGYSSPYGVWYSFVGDGQSTTITSVAGSGFDHEMVIMSGTTCGATYTLITNQDVGFSGGTETYTFTTINSTQYYIYIAYWSTAGLSTNTGTFTISRTCTAPPTPPINDNPSGAITLTIGNTVTYSTYTNLYATNTTTESTPSCAAYVGEDVWFKVTLPQYVTSLDFDTQTGVITDAGMAIYRGTPGSLTEIQCDDDSSPNGTMSFISRTDFFQYETIYIRIWEYNGGTVGTFGISVTSPQPLPVEMLYFEGVGYETTNLLKWATASEQNSNYFSIERSVDGYDWREVGKKESAGNSNEMIKYSYVDLFTNNSVVYYRLQQYDFDGQYKTYGPIVISNYQTDKKIVKYVNLLGQEVGIDSRGIIIEVYEDGTMRKIIR